MHHASTYMHEQIQGPQEIFERTFQHSLLNHD